MPSGHVDKSKPLKPLTEHAWSCLEWIARGPVPRHEINAGVVDRFVREGLADMQPMGNKGRYHVVITAAGREKLEERT